MENELKNLDIKDTSDAVSSNIIIERRNKNIQKDFFSAGEYLIYGTQQQIELPYYKNKKDQNKHRVSLKVSGSLTNGSSRRRRR